VPNHSLEQIFLDSGQESDLAPFLGDLSQNEKSSGIKPPVTEDL
jgi:hypothetical protein